MGLIRAAVQSAASVMADQWEEYFYCEPVDPDNPNGPQKPSEPKYEYDLERPLTEEEYNSIFSKCKEK